MITAELYEFIVRVVEEKVKDIKVTREEFDQLRRTVEKGLAELAKRVDELAAAQAETQRQIEKLAAAQVATEKRLDQLVAAQAATERRLEELAKRVDELAAAQAATERRLEELAKRVDQLAAAQAATERRLEELAKRVDELAAAQAATERRLEELAKRVDELAAAQAATQRQVEKLAAAVDALRIQVGRLSETVGFTLEDLAKDLLPYWLRGRLGVEVESLERKIIELEGEEVEVDLYAWGVLGDKKVLVVGEVKSRIYEDDVNAFYRKVVAPLSAKMGVEIIGILFGFAIHPRAETRARELGMHAVTAYKARV